VYNVLTMANIINLFSRASFRLKQLYKACKLKKNAYAPTPLHNIWNTEISGSFLALKREFYGIFGCRIKLRDINWHIDSKSGYEWPIIPFYRQNFRKFFNKDIDIKFPWEVSRLYFLTDIAGQCLADEGGSGLEEYKRILLEWDRANPFLMGVNWFSTLDVAVRAVNIIISSCIISPFLEKDNDFCQKLSVLLLKHMYYIAEFFEDIDNNHKISCLTGLLFLSLCLKDHPLSPRHFEKSRLGLIECMEKQVYEDGADYEGALPYHRYVLELFGYSAIICLSKNIDLGREFYKKLFKMFEYTSAYIDKRGNAPQIGDNDSGRVAIFLETGEHDHSYLFDIAETIFDFKFPARKRTFKQFLPKIQQKIRLKDLGLSPRDTQNSIAFEHMGAYMLKNSNFSVFIVCFPTLRVPSQHYHLDTGSFTLSYRGFQIAVDPGSYCYTSNVIMRKRFRSRLMHNIPATALEYQNGPLPESIWKMQLPYHNENICFEKNRISFEIHGIDCMITRIIYLGDDNIIIRDSSESDIVSLLHLHPGIKTIVEKDKASLAIEGALEAKIASNSGIQIGEYEYSPGYGVKIPAERIIAGPGKEIELIMSFSA